MRDEDDVQFESSEEESALSKSSGDLKRLKLKIKETEDKAREYLQGWQRAKADYINLQKQEAETRAQALQLGSERVLLDLIKVAESFELAMSNKPVWEEAPANWRTGIEYIYSQLQNIFKDYNLEIIDPLGEDFDPKYHHAIGTLPPEREEDKGKVANVLQKGYKLRDKIIKPAQVKTYE